MYAIAMIMVVSVHAAGGGVSLLSDWFPYGGICLCIFMFSSGYFYKRSSEDHLLKYIWKKTRTLMIPLYIYSIVYALFIQLTRLKGFTIGGGMNLKSVFIAPLIDGHQFGYPLGGWYVTPLFMVEVFSILVHKLLHKIKKDMPEGVFLVLSIILGIAGNELACFGYLDGWWLCLVRMLYFVPFYALGIFYKSNLEKYDKKIPTFWYLTCVFALKFITSFCFGKVLNYKPSWCDNFTEGPIMPIVIGVLGIALWLRIATVMEPVIGKSKWLNLVADNTYSIMMNHFLGFMCLKTVFALFNKFTTFCSDFDWGSYKSNLFWFYQPRGLNCTLILYVVVGIVFSIIVQKEIDRIKAFGKSVIGKIVSKKKA